MSREAPEVLTIDTMIGKVCISSQYSYLFEVISPYSEIVGSYLDITPYGGSVV